MAAAGGLFSSTNMHFMGKIRMPSAKRPSYAVPALDKGLDLLETLAGAAGGLSQSELARQLGRSASEIFRMLACLERRGYLEKDPLSGRDHLTRRLFALAHAHGPFDHLLRAAQLPMRELARRLGECCHLSVISQGRLVVLAQVESANRIRLSIEVGARFPLLYTLSGRLLLAHSRAAERDDLLAHDDDWQALDARGRARLQGELERLARSTMTAATSDLTTGVRDAAALVGEPGIGVAAVLCVPALIAVGQPKPLEQQVAAVAAAATAITHALGLSLNLNLNLSLAHAAMPEGA
jgi:DNA-binding IclR family transcriptional regulator